MEILRLRKKIFQVEEEIIKLAKLICRFNIEPRPVSNGGGNIPETRPCPVRKKTYSKNSRASGSGDSRSYSSFLKPGNL
jgi:hypothetical protein